MVLYCVPRFANTITGRLAVPSTIYTSETWGLNIGPQLGALLMSPKVGYQYTLAGTVLAQDAQHLKQAFLKIYPANPCSLLDSW